MLPGTGIKYQLWPEHVTRSSFKDWPTYPTKKRMCYIPHLGIKKNQNWSGTNSVLLSQGATQGEN